MLLLFLLDTLVVLVGYSACVVYTKTIIHLSIHKEVDILLSQGFRHLPIPYTTPENLTPLWFWFQMW